MDEARVILVMLRQPRRKDPNEMRSDPFWEFGSFGCTGCHCANLMNPRKLSELEGVRLGFAQGGYLGIKLVLLTPPISTQNHGHICEAKWHPHERPLTYVSAPTLVSNPKHSDVPLLMKMLRGVQRRSIVAKFASKFRSCRTPLPPEIGKQVVEVYKRWRTDMNLASIACSYVDALPYPPPCVDENRKATYCKLLRRAPRP
jgi:hypothetical protein